VYDYGVAQDGSFYYVMELLDGTDLERFVERFGPMPPERAVYVLLQACHSFAEAHARGLVHRDVKPANMYLCRQGLDFDALKVLDFGLVKPTRGGEVDDIKITQQGQLTGTPTYMAPELALGADPVDGRSDLYSLGCVGYWLLTGKTVFSSATLLGQLVAHRSESPEPVSSRAPVPAELDAVIARCLSKKPSDRFADAEALRAALAAVPLPATWNGERAKRWWEANMTGQAAALSSRAIALEPTVPVAAPPQ
jgi:serine/threonine-protein kinase